MSRWSGVETLIALLILLIFAAETVCGPLAMSLPCFVETAAPARGAVLEARHPP